MQVTYNDINEVCKEIGCSGMSQSCKDNPYSCSIINKIFTSKESINANPENR